MNKKIILLFLVLLLQNNIFAAKIGAYGTDIMPYIDMTNQFADTFVDFKYGFYINDGFATVKTGIPIKKQILFENTKSVLELESDTSFDSIFNFEFFVNQLNLQDSKNYGSRINSVDWSPDGNYLAIGGSSPTSGYELQIYSFIGEALTLTDSKNYGSTVYTVDWSPDGNYIAIGGSSPTSGYELQIYSFIGEALTLTDSKDYGSIINSVDWSPDGNYLAVGGNSPASGDELQVYSFIGEVLTLTDSKDYSTGIESVDWSPDGNYLAVGGYNLVSGDELQVYSFSGGALTLTDSKDYGTSIYSVDWSPDGNYLAVGGIIPDSGYELQVYSFSGGALTLVAYKDYRFSINSVDWSPDGNYLAVGGDSPGYGYGLQVYSFSGGALTLVAYKDYDSIIYSVDWSPDGNYLAVGGNSPISGDELQVYLAPINESGYISGNQNSLIINGDLIIPSHKALEFLSDTIINGQNKTLELEDEAQLIIDSNVTLTLRNIILQTGKNSDKKPIKLYMDGNLCLQNATIILDDDFLFENGNLFIKEDIKFSGPHEFIYSSTHKCYINKNSKLKFLQDATFTYSPKSIDRNLIVMKDKSSKLILKNCTLSSTYTGLRLTKGNLIFDGLVTVTSLDINTKIESETTTQTSNITFQDLIYTITYPNIGISIDFSPNGKLLAIGGDYHDGIGTGQILSINNYDEILTITSIPFPTEIQSISFSPNGKFLAVGGKRLPTSLNCGIMYKIDEDGYLEYATEIPYTSQFHPNPQIREITWSLDSKYIVVSGFGQNGEGAYIYKINQNGQIIGTTMFPVPYSYGEAACFSPDGKFLAAGGWHSPRTYQFNFDGSITELSILDYPSSPTSAVFSMQYSPDQKYLIAGGWRNGLKDIIRIFEINAKGEGLLYWTLPQTDITDARYVSWSHDGNQIVVASGPANAPSPNYSKIYTLDLPNKKILNTKNIEFGNGTGYAYEAAASPDLRIYAFVGQWDSPLTSTTNAATYIFSPVYDELISTTVYYGNSNLHPRGLDNYVTFGNASIGKSENLYIDILSGAKVDVHGTLNIENVA